MEITTSRPEGMARGAGARRLRKALGWTVLVVVLLIVAYLVVAISIARMRPNIAFDAFDRANELIPSGPIEAQAWPVYRRAMAWHHERQRMLPDFNAFFDDDATDQTRAEVIAVLRERSDEIALLRDAAARPILGVRFTRALNDEDRAWFTAPRLDVNGRPAPPDGGSPLPPATLLFEAPVPHMAILRSASRLLRADCELAVIDGDGVRAVDDLIAMLGVARHVGQMPVLVGQLTESGILVAAAEQTVRAMERASATIETADLLRLQRAYETIDPRTWQVDLAVERIMLEDFVQRTYSDDGAGDGILLPGATRRVLDESSGADDLAVLGGSLGVLIGRVVGAATPSRRETIELIDRLFGLVEDEASMPIAKRTNAFDREVEALGATRVSRFARQPVLRFLPTAPHADRMRFVASSEVQAAVLAIAIERFRRMRGTWPTTLTELVPDFLAEVPLDIYDGAPLRYRVQESGPLLWSVGPDGVDDDGAPLRSPRDRFGPAGRIDNARGRPSGPDDKGDVILLGLPSGSEGGAAPGHAE